MFSQADSLVNSASDTTKIDSLNSLSNNTPVLTDTLLLSFVKGNRIYSPDSTLFDIVRVENKTGKDYSGELSIEVSNGWKIISEPNKQLNIKAGQDYYFPLRISLPDNLTGGYSYIVTANYKTSDVNFSNNMYITIPRNSDWGLDLDIYNIYFNTLKNYVDYEYKLSNYGNSEEIIKVDYKVGRMLDIPDLENSGNEIYYAVPAHSDTIIKHRIMYKKGLSDLELDRYMNNYTESTISMQAQTDYKHESRRVAITRLESQYDNHNGLTNYVTPLNVEWQVYNLLSAVNPRYNIRAYGNILFNKDRSLNYHIAGISLPFSGSYKNVSAANNLFYRILYRSPLTKILLSSNLGNSSLLNSYGMGVNFVQTLSDNSYGQIIITRDRFLPITSVSATFGLDFKPGFGGRIGLGYYNDERANQIATSGMLGSNFTIAKHHVFDAEIAVSYNQFDPTATLPQQVTKVGFSYKFRYNITIPKFNLSVYLLNKSFNYFRNSNNSINNINGSYVFNEKNRLNLTFYNNSYLLDFYPYRFLKTNSWNRNIFGQLLYIRPLNPKLIFNAGPEYRFNHRDIFVLNQNYNKQLDDLFYGVYMALIYRMNEFNSISPNLRIGMAQTKFDDVGDNLHFQTNLEFAMRLGINYSGKYFRVLAFYQRGPQVLAEQAIIAGTIIPSQQSYQIRPYYERYFFKKTLRISSYINYMFLMPSNRSLVNWNLAADAYLKNGWEFGIANNSYTNQYINSEQALISNRGLNLYFRVKKSIDIQQPRIKFFDMTLVYFKDLNGNGIKDDHEPPIPNVRTLVERETHPDDTQNMSSVFVTQNLVSDPQGIIVLENIPNGVYSLDHYQINKKNNLFFEFGNEQQAILNSNQTVYVPLTESYKIRGAIVIDRDPNSDLGNVDISEIRVSAVSDSGITYFGLTNKFGDFIINIPPGHRYSVKVNNVLGDVFKIEKDEYNVEMFDVNTVNIDFIFVETRRGVNIKGEQFFDFNKKEEK